MTEKVVTCLKRNKREREREWNQIVGDGSVFGLTATILGSWSCGADQTPLFFLHFLP